MFHKKSSILYKQITDIFTSACKTSAYHEKGLSVINTLLHESSLDEFLFEFLYATENILIMDYKTPNHYLETLITFYSAFFSSICDQENDNSDDHPFVKAIIDKLINKYQNNVKPSVRYWSCKIISNFLSIMTSISNELFDAIKNSMLHRLNDPIIEIRLQCINCLHKLQDPSNFNDLIINKFLIFITGDNNSKIRKLCVEKIVMRSPDTFEIILSRIRDINENVRIAAFKRFFELPKLLNIKYRREMLILGFSDQSKTINEYVSTVLVPKWLEIYENDYFTFLLGLRLDADEMDIKETVLLSEKILINVFERNSPTDIINYIELNDKKLIPYEKLSWESVIYWKTLINFIKKSEYCEIFLKKILPEPLCFFKYVKHFCENILNDGLQSEQIEVQFVLKQLFLICNEFDTSDPATNKALNELVTDTLKAIVLTTDTAQAIISNLNNSILDFNERCNFICEIISEIIYPLDILEKADLLSNTYNIIKYLTILEAFLKCRNFNELGIALQTVNQTVIQELLSHPNEVICLKAVRCYSAFCIMDKTTAKYGVYLFANQIINYIKGEECDTQMLITSVYTVVDIIRINGSDIIGEINNEFSESTQEVHLKVFAGGVSLTDVIQGLVDLMDDEQNEVQNISGRGLCLLILNGCIISDSLISRIVIKWFNPANDCQDLIYFIGNTLEKLPTLPGFKIFIINSIFIIIKILFFAPKTSPLSDINIENVCKFLFSLCKIHKNGMLIHKNLATTICRKISQEPMKKINLIYSKILFMLDLPQEKAAIEDILRICKTINNIRDKIVAFNIKKYIRVLNKYINNLDTSIKEFKKVNLTPPKEKQLDQEESDSESENESEDDEEDEVVEEEDVDDDDDNDLVENENEEEDDDEDSEHNSNYNINIDNELEE